VPLAATNTNTNNFWGSVNKSEEAKQDFFANRNTGVGLPSFTKLTSDSAKVVADTNNNKENKVEEQKEHQQPMDASNKKEYHKELCELNVSVLHWIKSHVDENPCIDLQPVFCDYEKHMKDLEAKYNIKRDGNDTKEQEIISTASASTGDSKVEKQPSVFKTPDNTSSTTPVVSSSSNGFSMLKSSTPIPPNPFTGKASAFKPL